ncbi:MAG: hypothetical protein KDE51_13605, partial [Anaerolineales bacterium]|nr:hypothetical protein [Anaerolineales bacterium]
VFSVQFSVRVSTTREPSPLTEHCLLDTFIPIRSLSYDEQVRFGVNYRIIFLNSKQYGHGVVSSLGFGVNSDDATHPSAF